MLEVGDSQGARGLRVRVSSRRFVSHARAGHAAAELSVTLGDVNLKLPVMCVRSNHLVDHLLEGFKLRGDPDVEVDGGRALVHATTADELHRSLTARAWHRLVIDVGRGDVQLTPGGTEGDTRRVSVVKTARVHGSVDQS